MKRAPSPSAASNRPGALVMRRPPVVGETLLLRDVLPEGSEPYQATVERTWRDDENCLWVRFVGAAGEGSGVVFEVWLRPAGRV